MSTSRMQSVFDAVKRQYSTRLPPKSEFDPAELVRFSVDLPERIAPAERSRLIARAEQLEPWLQGPFYLGGDVVVGGLWRNDIRWESLEPEVPEDLSGRRVLDVGSNAGYDPFMFNLRGADYVLGCEPFSFIHQARFLESVYRSGADLQEIGWQQLDPGVHGVFDLVHCNGVLYHEQSPIELLRRLYEMTASGGTLLLGSMMLPEPEHSEFARFVPDAYNGDETWWWVPGPLAAAAMVESVGFEVERSFGEGGGPPGEFPTITAYVRAVRR